MLPVDGSDVTRASHPRGAGILSASSRTSSAVAMTPLGISRLASCLQEGDAPATTGATPALLDKRFQAREMRRSGKTGAGNH
jgi:hypothetical protein